MLMEEKDLFEEQNKEIEIAYTFSPVDKGKESKEREGKAKDKEDNKSPRISYSLSKGLSHPAHGEQLSLWPEYTLPTKKEKQKAEPFYFTPIQHQLIRAFSIYISQHGDNDKIAEFKKEIERILFEAYPYIKYRNWKNNIWEILQSRSRWAKSF